METIDWCEVHFLFPAYLTSGKNAKIRLLANRQIMGEVVKSYQRPTKPTN